MAPNRGSTNHRPKSLNSPPSALFNSNSSGSTNQNRTWQKSGSTSSLDNILTYNHNIQNQNDFNFDDDSNFQDYTSYSDSEIITLEEVGPGLSDEAAINGLSNQLQKGLVTDQTRSQQSKVNDSVKSDFNTLKHAVNEIESTLSSPLNNQLQYDNGNQYQILSDQDFYQTIPTKEFLPSYPVDNQPLNDGPANHEPTFKNERIESNAPAQIIRSSNKVFKTPLPPQVSLPKTTT